MTTTLPKTEDITQRWHLIDADGEILGKVAARVASVIRGKTKPTFTPHLDTGDHVVVVNVEKIKVTGNKLADKRYYDYSGYKGGMKSRTLKEVLASHPERALEHAVKCMLPKNKLGDKIYHKMHLYVGSEHPHTAQKPAPMAVNTRAKK